MRREDNTQLARELNALAIKAVESTPPAFRAHAGVDILRGVERTLAQGIVVKLNKDVLCGLADMLDGGMRIVTTMTQKVEWDDAIWRTLHDLKERAQWCD